MYIRKLFKNLPKKYHLHKFNNLKLDSRKCKQGDIFFSIKGVKENGNKFINSAINNGAKTIVSDLKFQGKKKIFYLLITRTLENLLQKSLQNIIKIFHLT